MIDAIVRGVDAIWKATDSVLTTVTAHVVSQTTTRDYDTGEKVPDPAGAKSDTLKALLHEFNAYEMARENVMAEDQKIMVRTADLVNIGSDHIDYFDISGIRWDVINPSKIPSDAIRIYHIRNTKVAV